MGINHYDISKSDSKLCDWETMHREKIHNELDFLKEQIDTIIPFSFHQNEFVRDTSAPSLKDLVSRRTESLVNEINLFGQM